MIANALNRGFIGQIRDTINSIEHTNTDPIKLYSEKIQTPDTKFHFKEVNMSDIRKTMKKLKNSGSSAKDMISMKT